MVLTVIGPRSTRETLRKMVGWIERNVIDANDDDLDRMRLFIDEDMYLGRVGAKRLAKDINVALGVIGSVDGMSVVEKDGILSIIDRRDADVRIMVEDLDVRTRLKELSRRGAVDSSEAARIIGGRHGEVLVRTMGDPAMRWTWNDFARARTVASRIFEWIGIATVSIFALSMIVTILTWFMKLIVEMGVV